MPESFTDTPRGSGSKCHKIFRLARQMFAVGGLVLCACLLGGALGFSSADNPRMFSPFNHNLSELGTYGLSPLAVLANGGVFFGGLLLSLGCLQGMRTQTGGSVLVWLLLALTWLSLAMTGLFPSNVYHLHTLALKWFFILGLAACLGYCLYLALRQAPVRGLWSLGICLLALLANSAFLLLPSLTLESLPISRPFYEEVYSPYPRPTLWWPATLQWLSLLTMLLWQAELFRRPD
ncbi:DUF998 domain-containing protein [Shewanella litorisediminis]|uniref:DUF998 domain-containing protein n=1 Tax=Shewanella litorisediminis TaxID=1173586 RepID=A0ABX7G6B1_9GAMM|nr:DUF998 domain-containing protein [Shewanella litorisediminis]MCL2917613.1 DUF998 domain-containing protein [Shewanella litorisediminis]QRH02738.1 DUF998 domain-containing protein [Shewanella litorisediminis]